MNHLRLELSPILPGAFALIEQRAREVLGLYLATRKLVDFDGPRGYEFSGLPLGRPRPISLGQDVHAAVRQVQPMLELRVPFELPLSELDDVDRGVDDLELDAVSVAAQRIATLEDAAVFYGVEGAHIVGMVPASTHPPIPLGSDFNEFPGLVSEAIARLHTAGVAGPYAIALDTASYTALLRATGPGGYPVLQHVRKLAEGPVVFAPALSGAVVLSMRGGDFELTIGEDTSIGYLSHDQHTVKLYLEETLTFRVLSPEAIVSLPLRSK